MFNLIQSSKITTSVGYQGKHISVLYEDLFCRESSAFICCTASIEEGGRDLLVNFPSDYGESYFSE